METSTTTESTTASTTETAPITTTEPAKTYDFGDTTGDGKVDAKDASRVLEIYSIYSTGGTPEGMTEEFTAAADVNSDGKVDAKDASEILSYYSYLSTGGDKGFRDYLAAKNLSG